MDERRQSSSQQQRRRTNDPRSEEYRRLKARQKRRKAIKRRLMMLFILFAVLIVLIIILIVRALAPSFKEAEVSTLTLNGDGRVILEEVLDMNGLNADKEDIESTVEESVSSFNLTNGTENDKAAEVKKVSYDEEEGTAYVRTEFRDAAAYSAYTGYRLFTGTVNAARAAGYDFGTTFYPVTDGKVGEVVTKDAITEGELQIVIVNENIDIKVNGTVRYMSANGTDLRDQSTVGMLVPEAYATTGSESRTAPDIYVIYQQ